MQTSLDSKICVDRFLCRSPEEQNLDQYGFLCGHVTYKDSEVTVTMENYYTLEIIKKLPFSFIVGNGGLGKTTLLNQLQKELEAESKNNVRINLRNLSPEVTLTERLKQHLVVDKEQYIILDAVDEAIDIGIISIADTISDSIKECIKINPNIKTIISSRDNRLPSNLVVYLQEIYHDKSENKFYLCALTENDFKTIAEHGHCINTDDFINKVKEYNLGCFASSPITLKPLIEMYNNGLIAEQISHYDIYENLINYLCEESDFRKEKDLNNELKHNLYTTKNLLFVASKIAIELKFKKKAYVTLTDSDIEGFNATKLEGQKYKLPDNTEILITIDLIQATLKTKIFYKSNERFFIAQQTYFDFLTARYIYNMKVKKGELQQILKVSGKYHPLLTETIAFLATKDDKLFKDAIKNIPDRILLSSVNFTKTSHKKLLFKTYLYLEKNKGVSIWNSFYNRRTFYKRISYSNMEKDIHKQFITADNKTKEILLNIIETNHYKSFSEILNKIIFNSKSSFNLKIDAISAASECQNNELLKKIAKNLYLFKEDIKNDSYQQILGSLLLALYPNFINDEEMFKLIEEDKNPHYHGRYAHFLSSVLPYQVNKKNHLVFLNWIKNNPLNGIVKCPYGSGYADITEKIFKNISQFVALESIPVIVDFHISDTHYHKFFSDDIFKKINENQALRITFIKELIFKYNNADKFRSVFWSIETLCSNTEDTPFFLKLYKEETDETYLKCYKLVLNSFYAYYIRNICSRDLELIYPILNNDDKLKSEFGAFINAVELSPETLEPVKAQFKSDKKYYYQKQKEKEQEKEQEILSKKSVEELIITILDNKKTTSRNIVNKTIAIFKYLNKMEDDSSYRENYSINIERHIHWNILSSKTKKRILDLIIELLSIKFTKEKYHNVAKYIQESAFNKLWKTFSLLPLIKENNIEKYNSIILYWTEAITYCLAEEDDELLIKQTIIKDIYEIKPEKIKKSIATILLNSKNYVRHNFFNGLNKIWDPEFSKWLYKWFINNQKKLDKGIVNEIVKILAIHNYTPIKDFILQEIKLNNENKPFLLSVILQHFSKEWSFVKKEIKNSDNPEVLLKTIVEPLEHMLCYDKISILKVLSPTQLSDFYNFSINLCPYLSEEKELGVHNVDYLKEFNNRIPQILVDNGERDAFSRIKKVYLKRGKDRNACKRYYNKMLEQLNYNIEQKADLNFIKLSEFERKYTLDKKSFLQIMIGYINNSVVNGDINIKTNM